MRQKASRYILINNMLYKNSIPGPYLRCLEKPEQRRVLSDIHDGDCGNHYWGRSLAKKIIATGYYWPTLKEDTHQYFVKCDSCQRHANMTQKPSETLHCTITPLPFMRWGMDIVGKPPHPKGRKSTYLPWLTTSQNGFRLMPSNR